MTPGRSLGMVSDPPSTSSPSTATPTTAKEAAGGLPPLGHGAGGTVAAPLGAPAAAPRAAAMVPEATGGALAPPLPESVLPPPVVVHGIAAAQTGSRSPPEVQDLGRISDLNVLLKPIDKLDTLGDRVHLLVPRGQGRRMGSITLLKHELLASGLDGRIRPVLPGAGHVFVFKVHQECPDADCRPPFRLCRVCALSEGRGPVDFRATDPSSAQPTTGMLLAPPP